MEEIYHGKVPIFIEEKEPCIPELREEGPKSIEKKN